MTGYGLFAFPPVHIYLIWLILSLVLPIIPMLIAAFLGFLIAKVSAGFKKTNLIQTVLTFIFVIFCFSLRYIIDAVFKEDKVEDILSSTSEVIDNAAGYYFPAKWFELAIDSGSIFHALLLLGVSVILFSGVFYVVGHIIQKHQFCT